VWDVPRLVTTGQQPVDQQAEHRWLEPRVVDPDQQHGLETLGVGPGQRRLQPGERARTGPQVRDPRPHARATR
jgi:multidrug efflux pump subunit AcrA (membrane-fusion protein)